LHSRGHSINQFDAVSKTFCRHALSFLAGIFFTACAVCGAETSPKFLGAASCANSSCHGGGGQNQNQFLVWSLKDFHSQRPFATLATARAKQIADALQIKDATADARCTVCHAPLHEVPENLRGENFKISEGVSCESCHGPAENWLRSHTRHDYTRADRTAAGMRDLQNLYVRANTCVACHQNVDSNILKAGHPELIFELDGQSVAEPKHWSAEKNGNDAQSWLVGQAVALREMSWQLSLEKTTGGNQINQWNGLFLLLNNTAAVDSNWPPTPSGVYSSVQKWSDEFARTIGTIEWTPALTKKILRQLAASDFVSQDRPISQQVKACEAGRLVLALDRLVAALPELKKNEPVQSALNELFKLAQFIPDFDPKQFSDELQKFSAALAAPP
jgi:Cytochrome c554 and c-prime